MFGFLILAKLSWMTALGTPPLVPSPVWFPSGFALAMHLLFGWEATVGVFLGGFFVGVYLDFGLPMVILGAVANTVEPLLAWLILRKWRDFDPHITRLRDLSALVAAGPLVGTVVGAFVGVMSLLKLGIIEPIHFSNSISQWWVSNSLSNLLLTPLILHWMSSRTSISEVRFRYRYGLMWIIPAAFMVLNVAFFVERDIQRTHYAYLVFPLIIWLAVRFPLRVASLGITLLAGAILWATTLGLGPFALEDLPNAQIKVQLFLAACAMAGMSLATLVYERERLVRQMRRALEARDDFINLAAHELKTPLSPLVLQIQRLNQLIRKGVVISANPRELQRITDGTESQLKKMGDLIGNLLNVSSLHEGHLSITPKPVNLSDLTQSVINEFSGQIEASGSSAVVLVEPNINGTWDPMRLQQVMSNLIANALKFSGGQAIEISLEQKDHTAVFRVQDHGMGISDGDKERIFERYGRSLSAKNYGGMGLGLYIVKEIVEAHEGEVTLESELGHGAKFSVYLPLQTHEDRKIH